MSGNLPQRKVVRMQGFDYSRAGAYFVMAVTRDREMLFGAIDDGELNLSPVGGVVLKAWNDLALRFPEIRLDSFVVMPNHVHGLIIIDGVVEKWAPKGVEVGLGVSGQAPPAISKVPAS